VKTLVNILGAGRSGTTMLDLMLGNGRRAFSLGEVHAWFRPFRRHHRRVDCNCGRSDCPYWSRILAVPENRFHTKAFERLGVDFLIDSSKNLAWVIDDIGWANANGTRVVNIAIYKPMHDYIYSVWKRGESVDAAIRRYKLYYGRLADCRMGVVTVPFVELVENPDAVLKALCAFTGQEFRPEMKEFWRGQHHQIFGSSGVRNKRSEDDKSGLRRDVMNEEFLAILPEISQKIAEDLELSRLHRYLSDNDYRAYADDPSKKRFDTRPARLYWYYAAKIKTVFRRFVPSGYVRK
jgi:hypothetical protein